ncbi:MAG TPA: hypothetical protein VF942_03780 [Acidimicrobiales bacterium]
MTTDQLGADPFDLVAGMEAAAILRAADHEVRRARAVLASGDEADDELTVIEAAEEAHRVLRGVEDLLGGFPAASEDHETWRKAQQLRAELGGYLLAASTLQETGVSTRVVASMLQRGAACAEELLNRVTRTPAPDAI